MSEDKFVWGKNDVLWHANGRHVAGWLVYDANSQMWAARSAGALDKPVVRAEFDTHDTARDFLMFIANAENQ